MFIVIEGLDGTGKSTVSKLLANKINAAHLSTPDKSLSKAREVIDKTYEKNTQARQLFYASTVVKISQVIEELLSQGKTVVVDRYWLSTQVYHNWRSNGQHLQLLEVEASIRQPDFTVYLQLPLEDRKARVQQRSASTYEDNLTLHKENDSKLNQLYNSFVGEKIIGNWLDIDASGDPETIVDLIISKLNYYCN